jgi:DNA-directed RNA polymerase I subunit RPA1
MAHVTVGIPRLRQLIMAGMVTNPTITLPLKSNATLEQANEIANNLSCISLFDVINKIEFNQSMNIASGKRIFRAKLELNKEKTSFLKQKKITTILTTFGTNLKRFIKGYTTKNTSGFQHSKSEIIITDNSKKSSNDDENEISEKSNVEPRDEPKNKSKKKKKDSDNEESEESGDDEEEDSEEESEEEKDPEVEVEAKKEEEEKIIEDEKSEAKNDGSFDFLGGICKYSYVKKSHHFNIQIEYSPQNIIYFTETIERAAKVVYIHQIPNIKKTNLIEDENMTLVCDGGDFTEVFKHDPDLIDFKNCFSNDPNLMAETFGIESANALIIKDIKMVFKMYGIPVDDRHITLISDHMTSQGVYRACNRFSMKLKPGPFAKMSFEQSSKFLVDAILRGEEDDIAGPSSRITMGRLSDQGSGSFSLRQEIKF